MRGKFSGGRKGMFDIKTWLGQAKQAKTRHASTINISQDDH
jgi:hypothetical protein